MVRTLLLLFIIIPIAAPAQNALKEREYIHTLTSTDGHGGQFVWKMRRADEVGVRSEEVSSAKLPTEGWRRQWFPEPCSIHWSTTRYIPSPTMG